MNNSKPTTATVTLTNGRKAIYKTEDTAAGIALSTEEGTLQILVRQRIAVIHAPGSWTHAETAESETTND